MNGLTSALSQALSGLVVTQSQTAVVSRNITRASEDDYSRKILGVTTDFSGNSRAANISRVVEQKLADSVSISMSSMSGQKVVSEALQTLSETIGDVETDGSIAWGIGQMQVALSDYEAAPNSTTAANNAIAAAGRLAISLNEASSLVSRLRQDSDTGIAASVASSNRILSEIEELNSQITSAGNDSGTVVELTDKRDAAIKRLSEEMGIRSVQRPNYGIAIYTDSGVTLFDVRARAITFDQSNALSAGVSGNAVFIDGVQVTGAGAQMQLRQGRVVALTEVRDSLAVIYQSQMDEIARSLVTLFAEVDQGQPPVLPVATGLFSYGGSPAVPSAATLIPGLASQIKVNAAFDPTQGGNPALLRDGGSNGVAYVYNATGVSGFQSRLAELVSKIDASISFAPSAGLDSGGNVKSFASLSSGWIEQKRSEAESRLETVSAALQRASDALGKKSGVNIDEEMAILLHLEKSYQAAAKVMSTVDQMMTVLMEIVN